MVLLRVRLFPPSRGTQATAPRPARAHDRGEDVLATVRQGEGEAVVASEVRRSLLEAHPGASFFERVHRHRPTAARFAPSERNGGAGVWTALGA